MNKEQITEALRNVIYFPESDNIIALNMVEDLQVNGKNVSFSLVFPLPNDRSAEIVKKACIATILQQVDPEAKVEGNIQIKVRKPQNKGGLSEIKNIIVIASGKGGVGKSTVAANLAVALGKTGAKVGILDADIYGPSVPLMFGLTDARPEAIEEDGKTIIIPLEKYGLKILSIGFFVDPSQALIWRGPMASSALNQLLHDTAWGELDYLIADLPPGTGDIHLTMVQEVSVTGVAIVTTPQQVALADAIKAYNMFRQEKINVPILGLVENMAYFTPAELPGNKYYIFGKEGGKKISQEYGIPLLGQIPIVQSICESGDTGKPVVTDDDSIVGKAFMELAQNFIRQVELRNQLLEPTKRVEINPNAGH